MADVRDPREPQILDRHGRPITAGCEIVLMQPAVCSLFVKAITHAVNVDPRAPQLPPGMMRVQAVATFDIVAPKGTPSAEFVLSMTREQMIAAGRLKEKPAGAPVTGDEVQVPVPEGDEPKPPAGPKLVVTDILDPRD